MALVDYATPIVGDRDRAEDVVQEAWLRIAATPQETSGPIVQPVSYLYRVVRNLAIDLARRLGREVRGESADVILAQAPSAQATPEAEALHRNELAIVLAALEELPERTRLAFRMHRFEDRTYGEIGKALGISQGRAYGIVADAVAHCMRRLIGEEP